MYKIKYHCNPLDPNSTLNMDNGSGGLPNKTNKARDFSKKRNFTKPPTTEVHPIMDRGGIKSSRAKWTTAKVLPLKKIIKKILGI